MTEVLKPTRGGFQRAFGCGWFTREFLKGNGPEGSPKIDPEIGAPQVDIFHYYKTALLEATARDRATRSEEKKAKVEGRAIDPYKINKLIEKHLAMLPFKTNGCRYHSFVSYFGNIQRLGWVEPSGREESSSLQDSYFDAPSRKFFRLTEAGLNASDAEWANPQKSLYINN